jgi:hypothetical protein
MGILAAAENEFYAHLMKREFCKAGFCDVKKTEYHPDGDFCLEDYKEELRKKIEARKEKESK